MTKDMIALCELLGKSADADFLREMISFAAHRLMEMEVTGQIGASHGERSPNRVAQRNGYRERSWETRAGTVDLKIPKIRKGQLFPRFPGTPADGREGPNSSDPGSLRSRHFDALA